MTFSGEIPLLWYCARVATAVAFNSCHVIVQLYKWLAIIVAVVVSYSSGKKYSSKCTANSITSPFLYRVSNTNSLTHYYHYTKFGNFVAVRLPFMNLTYSVLFLLYYIE